MKRLVFTLIAMVVCLLIWHRPWKESLITTSLSPDGSMRVEIYRVFWWKLEPSPGASGDAPVAVYVKDSSGSILARWPDLMIQNAGPVEWFSDHVSVGPEMYFFHSQLKEE